MSAPIRRANVNRIRKIHRKIDGAVATIMALDRPFEAVGIPALLSTMKGAFVAMSVFSRFFHSRDKPEELRRAQDTLGGSRFSFFFGGSTSGKPVNERTALQMTAVYSCVRILSEAVASLPLHVYRYGENGSKVKALDHPLYRLLHDEPNPEMTSFNFRETLMGHLLLYGNAYAQIIRNGKGEVIGLYPLMPTKMTVDRDSKGQIYYLYTRGSDDSPVDDENGQVYLPPEQVLHIPGLGYDGIVGYSPIAMAKNAVGMAIACEEYGAKFFANDAAPGRCAGTSRRSEKSRIKCGQSWNKLFRGSANSHQIAVLEEGLKYQPIGISPEQAQFLERGNFRSTRLPAFSGCLPTWSGIWRNPAFPTSSSRAWNLSNTPWNRGLCAGNRAWPAACFPTARNGSILSASM